MTDDDLETVKQAITTGKIKILARANGISIRTITQWRHRLGFRPVMETYTAKRFVGWAIRWPMA